MKLAERAELFLLLSLVDLGGASTWNSLFHHVRQERYLSRDLDERDFPGLRFEMIAAGYVTLGGDELAITEDGLARLRFLCGQAGSVDATAQGHKRIRQFRAEYDGKAALKQPPQSAPTPGKHPTPDRKLLQRERLREEIGEDFPYKVLARAKNGPRIGDY